MLDIYYPTTVETQYSISAFPRETHRNSHDTRNVDDWSMGNGGSNVQAGHSGGSDREVRMSTLGMLANYHLSLEIHNRRELSRTVTVYG